MGNMQISPNAVYVKYAETPVQHMGSSQISSQTAYGKYAGIAHPGQHTACIHTNITPWEHVENEWISSTRHKRNMQIFPMQHIGSMQISSRALYGKYADFHPLRQHMTCTYVNIPPAHFYPLSCEL
jgi:hypothetical protein